MRLTMSWRRSWLDETLTLTHGRSPDVPQPAAVPAGLLDDPVGQRADQPARFGHRNELAGRDEAAVAEPANERLVADRPAGPQVDHGLIVETEIAAGDAVGEVGPELELGDRGRLHRRLEDLDTALAAALGQVHRDVGVADEIVGGPVVGAGHGHADAGSDREPVAGDVERHAQGGQNPLGDPGRDQDIGAGRQGDDELVPAEPGRRVAVADHRPQSLADATSSASPASWPKLSLTALKSSRSTSRTATSLSGDRFAKSAANRSAKRLRLGSDVRAS